MEEMAAKQRQAEIAAEEREKREREEALRARLDDKPGKFIPPSLRKKLESGEDLRRDVRPQLEERRPLFGRSLAPSRETDRQVEGEGDAPPPPSSNRYQPPRARDPDAPPPGAYQPPVRRATYDAPGARGDAYEPPRPGAYAPPGRPGSRPLGQRPVIGGGRPAEDRPERQDRW